MYLNHDLYWRCELCGYLNIQPMHSDPIAHLLSTNCENCEEEIESCPCAIGLIIDINRQMQHIGAKGGKNRMKKMSKEERSQLGKIAAKKRWQN